MARLLLFATLLLVIIADVATKCDIGFFCDENEDKRDNWTKRAEKTQEKIQRKKQKTELTRQKFLLKFLENAHKFLEKNAVSDN